MRAATDWLELGAPRTALLSRPWVSRRFHDFLLHHLTTLRGSDDPEATTKCLIGCVSTFQERCEDSKGSCRSVSSTRLRSPLFWLTKQQHVHPVAPQHDAQTPNEPTMRNTASSACPVFTSFQSRAGLWFKEGRSTQSRNRFPTAFRRLRQPLWRSE